MIKLGRWETNFLSSHLAKSSSLPSAVASTTFGASPFPNETRRGNGCTKLKHSTLIPNPSPLVEQRSGTDAQLVEEGAQVLGYALPFPTNHHEWPARGS